MAVDEQRRACGTVDDNISLVWGLRVVCKDANDYGFPEFGRLTEDLSDIIGTAPRRATQRGEAELVETQRFLK